MTKEQERARARRRHEKSLEGQKAPVSEATKDKQMFGVILALLLIVAAVIVVPRLMPDRTDSPTASPTDVATGTATATGGLKAGQALAKDCVEPPALQATPKTFTTVPDKAAAAGKTFIATVTTTCGDVQLELFGDKAPQTVASFMHLAKEGYWAPSPCHRLTTEGLFVLQCGDPTGTGSGGPGYGFGIENAPKDGKYPTGTLAMARTQDPNSNGGQFFITYKDTQLPTDGGGYSIFGKVVSGMEIIDRIAAGGILEDGQTPVNPISIISVSVTEKKA